MIWFCPFSDLLSLLRCILMNVTWVLVGSFIYLEAACSCTLKQLHCFCSLAQSFLSLCMLCHAGFACMCSALSLHQLANMIVNVWHVRRANPFAAFTGVITVPVRWCRQLSFKPAAPLPPTKGKTIVQIRRTLDVVGYHFSIISVNMCSALNGINKKKQNMWLEYNEEHNASTWNYCEPQLSPPSVTPTLSLLSLLDEDSSCFSSCLISVFPNCKRCWHITHWRAELSLSESV